MLSVLKCKFSFFSATSGPPASVMALQWLSCLTHLADIILERYFCFLNLPLSLVLNNCKVSEVGGFYSDGGGGGGGDDDDDDDDLLGFGAVLTRR
jgi:hypothetical protein